MDRTEQPAPKARYPKYEITQSGVVALHASSCLTKAQKTDLKQLYVDLEAAGDDKDAYTEILNKIRGYGVKGVRVLRANLLDHSRYDGATLRAIRAAGGGQKEQARAAKRRAA